MSDPSLLAFLLDPFAPKRPSPGLHRTRVVKLLHTWAWYCRECRECSLGGPRHDSWADVFEQAACAWLTASAAAPCSAATSPHARSP